MKTSFRGYYRPSEAEFADLWSTATFVLDANVLLNMYGYSQRTRSQLMDLLRSIEERLWVPHQFAKEYQKNRAKSVAEQVGSYATAKRELSTLLEQRLRVKHKHPFVSKRSLADLERICAELERGQKDHERLFTIDPNFQEISKMLEGRVGAPPSKEELAKRCDEARSRYLVKTPPGYSDSAKPEPDSFGDYFGWKEILTRGADTQTPTILVTDDQKEDWWLHFNKDRRLGPRPELVAEYWDVCQKPFYMYTLEEFMRYAQQHLDKKITSYALEEVRERSASQAEATMDEKPKDFQSDLGMKPLGLSMNPTGYSAGDDPKSSGSPDKPVIT